MQIDGFSPEIVNPSLSIGETTVTVIPNRAYDEVDNVDCALVVRRGPRSVVNMNDNPMDQRQIDEVLAACGGPPDVAFLPYAGAGPYPQTYTFSSAEDQVAAAEAKRGQFLGLFSRYVELLEPRRAVPFAGKYWLGGPLAELNGRRGVPDAVEALEQAPGRAVVLADGGEATIDAATLEVSSARNESYDPAVVATFVANLPFHGYDYEREIVPLAGRPLPIETLLSAAYAKALVRARTSEPFWFCVMARPGVFWCFDTAGSGLSIENDVSEFAPRCEIAIDERYLFGLLTRLYHWNNAEIGSHYRSRRVPDVYRRDAYGFLHYMQV